MRKTRRLNPPWTSSLYSKLDKAALEVLRDGKGILIRSRTKKGVVVTLDPSAWMKFVLSVKLGEFDKIVSKGS